MSGVTAFLFSFTQHRTILINICALPTVTVVR
jgi:hypothetical protein